MKAWVLHNIDRLCLEEAPEPELSAGEVLVEVKAAGICGSDIPRIYKTGTYSYPLIPGHEFSGVVVKTGADADEKWTGTRVGVFPLIPCKACAPCRRGQFEMCRSYSYLGSRRDGGFAGYVAVPEENLIALPDGVSFEEAAMLEPMAVAVHALRRLNPAQKDTVVICGLGTIGLLLLMFLLDARTKAGACSGKVLAVGNTESQREMAWKIGLSKDSYCDGSKEDAVRWIMERTEGQGADAFFECVGRNETLTWAVDSTAPGGKLLVLGNPFSDMTLKKPVYWKILRNQLTITGTWNSSFTRRAGDDWHYVLECLVDKRIAPAQLITHRFPLEELDVGLRIMRDKTEDYVKIMGVGN